VASEIGEGTGGYVALNRRMAQDRLLTVGALLLWMVGASSTGVLAGTSASSIRYTSTKDRYAFSYPSTWHLNAQQLTASRGPVEAGIAPVEAQVVAPDHLAVFSVVVRHSATASARMRQEVIALMQEGTPIIGRITFSTPTINGVRYLEAAATARLDATHQGQGMLIAASRGNTTYYAGTALVLNQVHTTQERAALAEILASFGLAAETAVSATAASEVPIAAILSDPCGCTIYGASVALSADTHTAATGTMGDSNLVLLERSLNVHGSHTETFTLSGPANSLFGAAVALAYAGHIVIVGAGEQGAVYIYRWLPGTRPKLAQVLKAPENSSGGTSPSSFGANVLATDSGTIVVGDLDRGMIYVYRKAGADAPARATSRSSALI
jgi:hypothetical protein